MMSEAYVHYFGMDTPSNAMHWVGRKCRSLLLVKFSNYAIK